MTIFIHSIKAEVRMESDDDKDVFNYARYYQGVRAALAKMDDDVEQYIKGDNLVYVKATLRLAMDSIANAGRWLRGEEIRFKNRKMKGKKLIGVEAYFMEEVL